MGNFKALLLLLLPATLFSQSSDVGNWLIYFGNKEFKSGLNWHHEVQYRNYDAVGDLEQLLLRTGIGYTLPETKLHLLLGYGYVHSQNYIGETDEKNEINEHRIYQQLITRQQLGSVSLQHRYRFEQRFVEDDFRLRFRYFLSINLPLTNPTLTEKTLYLSSYNEIFINTEGNVFDRNRLYGGIGYKLDENIRFELGYMNQFFTSDSRDQLNVIAFVNL